MAIDYIRVKGAREHNLKNISLDIPRDCLVVITGLSGSGKSSLAFETLYQEGQRRFMESLSAYARQFLGQMSKPQVDSVEGLSPTVCIDQKTVNRNPRSTVGTITEILDHYRLLMARLGTPHCPICNKKLESRTASQISEGLLTRHPDARLIIMAPIVIDRKGEYRAELDEARRMGFVRARIDGKLRELQEDIQLARYEKHTIELVLDRLKAKESNHSRLTEAIENAILKTENAVSVLIDDTWKLISAERTCPDHGISAPELEPRLFSFNAPQGMCPECNGLGYHEGFSPETLFDPNASVLDAFKPFGEDNRLPYSALDKDLLKSLCKKMNINPNKQWQNLSERELDKLLYGDNTIEYETISESANRRRKSVRTWQGFLTIVESIWKYTKLKRLAPYRHRVECFSCQGNRLNPLALAVTFREVNIADLSKMSIEKAHDFFKELQLNEKESHIGQQIVKELRSRLQFLNQVGLSYLSIDRKATTLSGGEAQRIRLAAQVGSGLQGVTYVLDEPSIGLHHRDQGRLLKALEALRDKGNSIIVVEHDPLTMTNADHLIEIGPGAGIEGGEIVAQGSPKDFMKSKALTAKYLRGEKGLQWPQTRRPKTKKHITIRGCQANNLQNLTVHFPIGLLIAVTGVSGSGKSSLISETLSKSVAKHLHGSECIPGKHSALEGMKWIDKLVVIDQSPIGRNPRSNPATYTGIMTPIRELMAQTLEARRRGYAIGRFSFNVATERGGGRCEDCEGAGVKTIEMQMLANVYVTCEACNGKRFNPETLDVRYKGKNIADILEMSIFEAAAFFAHVPKIKQTLETLLGVGMGYVKLGQPSTTLSGGEAQRIKLASYLSKKATGKTLFILDEPTTGLHMADVEKLVGGLQELVSRGNTVIVIEHDSDVIKCADHIIDMGPEGGVNGGQVIAEGTPEEMMMQNSPTGTMLREIKSKASLSLSTRGPKPSKIKTKSNHPIEIVGAETHNLRHINVTFPQGKMTVVTGPSGSGKSSLAFHTLFAEGQRRYVESLSTYARRFLGRLQRPPVDKIDGLAPAIAIDQRNRGASPRSTVATATEIHDTLRLLYARIGKTHCPICDTLLKPTSSTMAAMTLKKGKNASGRLLSDMSGDIAAGELISAGFSRIWTNDKEQDLEDPLAVLSSPTVVVDRFNPHKASRSRIAESVAIAYGLGQDMTRFEYKDGEKIVFTRDARCPIHGRILPEKLSPRHFSFNTRLGACQYCDGLGTAMDLDMSKLFPRPEKPLWEGCHGLVKASFGRSAKQAATAKALFDHYQTSEKTPISDWSPALRQAVLFGCDQEFEITYRKWGNEYVQKATWIGLRAMIDNWRSDATWLRTEGTCSACNGKRLRPEILSVKIAGHNIAQACEMTIDQARDFWETLMLNPEHAEIALQPIIEICSRIRFLSDVGVGYLTLDRSSRTLSGGESQRIRLASQLGARLTRSIYVLDEPTIGLHHRDTHRLLDTLKGLRALNNTLVIVEHDPEVIAEADHLIDMGPEAGKNGGQVVATGTPKSIASGPSLTGQYLSGRLNVAKKVSRRKAKGKIHLKNANKNNLKNISIGFGRGILTVVTGVSGSGKSSLVMGELADKLKDIVEQKAKDKIQKYVIVDQKPISRSPRSTPVSYCKLLDPIRDIFAKTIESKRRGWTKTRYSYNTKEGRCDVCEGRGATLIEMHFLSDVWVQCESCLGARYDEPTLEVRWKGKNIADVLNMSVEQAFTFFSAQKKISTKLKALMDVGLGYLRLGQPTNQLSGGEAQRLKLGKELAQGSRFQETCFLLDEPTTGLHYSDVSHLMASIDALVERGHMVVIIEHNLDVLWCADEIIDLGPEGGDQGGQIMAQTTPEKLLKYKAFRQNHTAIALKNRENRPF